MGEIQQQMLRGPSPISDQRDVKRGDYWLSKGVDHDQNYAIASSTSSFYDSSASHGSTSSLDSTDDASSSNSSSQSNGPLEDFTELLAQLPIKNGLSMFYKGKSQSFTSLSRVKSIEDLAKDSHRSYSLPKAKAPNFKKASSPSSSTRASFSSFHVRRRGSTLNSSRPPSIAVCDESF